MKKAIPVLAAFLAIAGCATNSTGTGGGGTGGGGTGGGTGGTGATPAGFADGTKTINTANLIFTARGQGVTADSTGWITGSSNSLQDTVRTTSDPNVIIATINGQDVTLTYDSVSGQYVDSSGNNWVFVDYATIDGQAGVVFAQHQAGAGQVWGVYEYGLQTNPASMPTSGTAAYTGNASLLVAHEYSFGTGNYTSGTGTVVLAADFANGLVGGTMTLSDDGTSSLGYAIPAGGTTLSLNSAGIAGNRFNGTWTAANLADLHMSSISGASYSGGFYGTSAQDVAGTLLGTGVSGDGFTPAYVVGDFVGQ